MSTQNVTMDSLLEELLGTDNPAAPSAETLAAALAPDAGVESTPWFVKALVGIAAWVAAILLGVAPFFFPVAMNMLGLLTGVVQAYIFAILATVYISSATSPPPGPAPDAKDPT